MDEFKFKIIDKENKYEELTYIAKNGKIPVMLTAVHTMIQRKEDGSIKYSEPFTKAIALFVSDITNCSCLIKNKDTGIDSNHSRDDTFKDMLLDNIKTNNIKLVIDLHGAKEERKFDVELGTLNNLSSDFSTTNELIDAFNEQGIFNIECNNPFKGGSITQNVYSETDCDVIQIEINAKYRDIENPEKIKQVTDSLINFIKYFNEILER